MKTSQHAALSRRAFLGNAAKLGVASAAVSAVPGAVIACPLEGGNKKDKDKVSRGYQETQHVRDYYKTASV